MLFSYQYVRIWLASVVLASAAFPVALSAGEIGRGAEQISHWIDALDDDQYRIREQAMEKLLEIGSAARSQLREVAESPKLELRTRARRLLVLIEDGDFQRRLDEFAADLDGTRGATLPGWERYRQAVGSDVTSRALFVEMQRYQPDLFAMAFGDEAKEDAEKEATLKKLEQQLSEQLTRLLSLPLQSQSSRFQIRTQAAQRTPSVPLPALASCASVMFIGTEFSDKPWNTVSDRLFKLTQKPPLATGVLSGAYRSVIRKLMANWIVDGSATNSQSVDRKIGLIVLHQLEGTLPYALRVALDEVGIKPQQAKHRAKAVLAIGKLGDEQMVKKLHPLLKAEDQCLSLGRRNVQGKVISPSAIQLRDVVLAVLLVQSGQDLKEYGLAGAKRHNQFLFELRTLAFKDNEQREKAFAKWHAWNSNGEPEASAPGETR